MKLSNHDKSLILTALRRAAFGLTQQLGEKAGNENRVYDTAYWFARLCRHDINALIVRLETGGWKDAP